jgi:hypothetical protein
LPVVTATFGGGVTVGGVVSTTVMLNAAGEDVLPAASLAVHETVVVPSGNVCPDVWSQDTLGAGSSESVAVTENWTLAPPGPVASTVLDPGTDTVGGVVST